MGGSRESSRKGDCRLYSREALLRDTNGLPTKNEILDDLTALFIGIFAIHFLQIFSSTFFLEIYSSKIIFLKLQVHLWYI